MKHPVETTEQIGKDITGREIHFPQLRTFFGYDEVQFKLDWNLQYELYELIWRYQISVVS